MRQIIIAILIAIFGPIATLILERHMTSAPEWIWRLLSAACIIAGIIIAILSNPIYSKLKTSQNYPIFSTIIVSVSAAVIIGAIWWFIIIPSNLKEQPKLSTEVIPIPPKLPTAEEIATELAKKLPSTVIQSSREKEIPKKEPTFKDVSPFTVIVGSNSVEISKDASGEKPQHIVKIGDTDVIDAYVENNKLYVNTILYGSPILASVEIKHNEFIVRPPQWDRNFDDTALE